MTRLTKIAYLHLGSVAFSIVVFVLAYIFIGPAPAMASALLACLPAAFEGRFKGREMEWDEMEQRILHSSQRVGLWMVWLFVIALTGNLFAGVFVSDYRPQTDAMIPISTVGWFFIAGVWTSGMGSGAALLWYQQDERRLLHKLPCFRGRIMLGLVLSLSVAMGGWLVLVTPELSWLAESKGFGGYTQIDEWRVMADGQVHANSRILLDRWPERPRKVVITLPYEDGEVTAAAFAGQPVDFACAHPGMYEVTLPPNYPKEFNIDSPPLPWPHVDLWPAIRSLEIEWIVPLTSIGVIDDASNPYRARLQSLIPTHNYELTIIAEVDSGFEIVRDAEKDILATRFQQRIVQWDRMTVFSSTRADGGYDMDRGSCSMRITPAADRDPLGPITYLPGTSEEDAAYIAESVRRINDGLSEGFYRGSVAVYALVNVGEPALPALLDLMLQENELARDRASEAIAEITRNISDTCYDDEAERVRAYRELQDRLGRFDSRGSREDREETVRQWRDWLEARSDGMAEED
jgi:hypothetical protein